MDSAGLNFEVRLTMKVLRRDGTVEYVEQEWHEVPDEEKKRLLALPSFLEWLKGKGGRGGIRGDRQPRRG